MQIFYAYIYIHTVSGRITRVVSLCSNVAGSLFGSCSSFTVQKALTGYCPLIKGCGVTASKLDPSSLAPFSISWWGRMKLGFVFLDTSEALLKVVDN